MAARDDTQKYHAPGVTVREYQHAQYFNGSEDALVDAGVVQREWLPGQPGNNKYSVRLVLEGDKYRMLTNRYERVADESAEISIKRLKKDGYQVNKPRSASEKERFKCTEALQERQEALQEARDKESKAISYLPSNAEAMREQSLDLVRRLSNGVGRVLVDHKANGGYAFGPEFLTELDIVFKRLLGAIGAHTIYFNADERDKQVMEIKRKTIDVDPDFYAFMSSTLALAKASISSGKMSG